MINQYYEIELQSDIMGEGYFYSNKNNELLAKFDKLIYIYDIEYVHNLIYIISEIDVFVLKNNLNQLKHIKFSEIVFNYEVKDTVIVLKFETGNINIIFLAVKFLI